MDITPNKDGGLLKEILREGQGTEQPFPGDSVTVHYVGTLAATGEEFDSSRSRGEKFTFDVGKGSVIKGWDLGIPTMKRGELAKFTIRSDYAYGESGSPPSIGPNATLCFEVELFDFHGEDLSEAKDKSLIKRIVKAGSGFQSPNEAARCVISLKGLLADGGVFDERDNVEFELGEGASVDVCEGVETALLRFKKDEVARLCLKPSRAKKAIEKFALPSGADVVYEVELKSFEKAKESWQLNGEEKLEQAELIKNRGTELFKEGNFQLAAKKYAKAVEFLLNETYELEEQKLASSKLQLAANLNLAACYLKLNENRKAIEACEKALQIEANSEKGLFRLGQAQLGLGEYEQALSFFGKVLEVNAQNREAAHFIQLAKQKIKESTDKEKALYSRMISALSK